MESKEFIKDIINKEKTIGVVGLGYVGIPLMVELGKYFKVIGFDIDEDKIAKILVKNNIEDFPELKDINRIDAVLTSDEKKLKDVNFFIITVPTPIDNHNNPDLEPILSATRLVGRNMPSGSIIVYESTVYPGLTEEICVPILEEKSRYKNKKDFWVGYSPERINPGDDVHTLENIIKIISAQDDNALEIIEKIYSKIIKAGLYKADSIKIAEAAKVIENIQRDLNIALINELALIFNKMGIESSKVFEAARTKWNFLDFRPGLVGGHCIGVDPYYLTYKALEIGYYPEIILSGRRINDNMSKYIGMEIVRNLLRNSKVDGKLDLVLFGITFKENVKDIRNSKVFDLYMILQQYGIDVRVHDPVADKDAVKKQYGIDLLKYGDISNINAAVFCVAHDVFKKIDIHDLGTKFKNKPYIFDIKGIFEREVMQDLGFNYWRL
jgi:UDP-N-acetyl-D-glucosamine/UDP-N-acetyl-D-galactosamine dehydrogenase